MPDPYRLNMELLAAVDSPEQANALMDAIREHLPSNAILELGTVEAMDHRDVIPDSPLAALLYGEPADAA